MTLDKRINPFRPDLAAEHLRGQVSATRFAAPEIFTIRDGVAPLLRDPRPDAMRDSELVFGEDFAVYDTDSEGWCWGQSLRDSYVGYIAKDALGPRLTPSHRVSALRTFVYPVANIKAPPIMALSYGSLLALHPDEPSNPFTLRSAERVSKGEGASRDFFRLSNGFYIWASHAAPLDQPAQDFVAEAERFLGIPYLWGGRSSLGLDCSALVQLSSQACGRDILRDSDMQEQNLGSPVNGPFQRGDLVFWKGHVGLMQSETQLLHANGYTMSVYSEPLDVARARILAKGGGDVTSLKRL